MKYTHYPNMKQLEPFTASQVIECIAEDVELEYSVPKSMAKDLVINAISYNVVADTIRKQVAYILGIN